MRTVVEADFEAINEWRKQHEAPIISRDLYPPIGIIEPGIAAGWINFTQTRIAFMENFVSNPKADVQKKEEAIMTIIAALERLAYNQGVKWVIAVTNHPKIEKYIYKSKAERLPGKVYGKELLWE